MNISLILATADDGTIGNKGSIPWHISHDLQLFKEITNGHPIIMGRKTFDSIGRPLAERKNIVISRNMSFKPDGVVVVGSADEAIMAANQDDEVFIIGGAEIFNTFISLANKMYLTEVHRQHNGDTKFIFDRSVWKTINSHEYVTNDSTRLKYSISILIKCS